MRKTRVKRLAVEFQEISPAKNTIIVLVKARSVSHRRSNVIRHVFRSFIEWEFEESLCNTHRSPNEFSRHAMIHYLYIYIYIWINIKGRKLNYSSHGSILIKFYKEHIIQIYTYEYIYILERSRKFCKHLIATRELRPDVGEFVEAIDR